MYCKVYHYHIHKMIPTLQCDTQFNITSDSYSQIFLHIISKKRKRHYKYPSNILSLTTVDDNITVKCDNYRDVNDKPIKLMLTYPIEWVNIMYVLSNLSARTKRLLLNALNVFPSRTLWIIYAILTISHTDIKYLLLRKFAESIETSHTIHTCVIHNGIKELILCYSTFCGHVLYDEHNVSRNVLKYVSDECYTTDSCNKLAKIMFPNDWFVDDIKDTYLLNVHFNQNMLILGNIQRSKVTLFAYIMNHDNKCDNVMISQIYQGLYNVWYPGSAFYNFANQQSPINNVRHNWTLLDGKLC